MSTPFKGSYRVLTLGVLLLFGVTSILWDLPAPAQTDARQEVSNRRTRLLQERIARKCAEDLFQRYSERTFPRPDGLGQAVSAADVRPATSVLESFLHRLRSTLERSRSSTGPSGIAPSTGTPVLPANVTGESGGV